MKHYPRFICVFLLFIVLSGCAQEQEQIVVPVAGRIADREQQKIDLRANLAQTFPKLGEPELNAIDSIARAFFVANVARHRAYMDYALPIGSEQTTLKMSDIGFVLSEIGIKPADQILEIGTGTGYLTAILSRLGAQIYSVEINEYLSEIARQNMKRYSLSNVHIRNADGLEGWSRFAPYDVVIITASVRQIPDEIMAQLKPGARIAVPIRDEDGTCRWMIYQTKGEEKEIEEIASRESNVPDAILPVVVTPEE